MRKAVSTNKAFQCLTVSREPMLAARPAETFIESCSLIL